MHFVTFRPYSLSEIHWTVVMSIQDLPAVNAVLNSLSSVFLVTGYVMIRGARRVPHRNCMLAALISSTLFLMGYLTYHANVGHTSFRDPSWFRPIYLGILLTHVLLAAAIVPLVLMTVWRAARGRFEAHRKIARWTLPLWLYVSVTGVLIYFLLYHIFPQGAAGNPAG